MTAGSIRAAKAHVEIGVQSKLQAGLNRAARQLDRFGQRMRSIGAGVRTVGMQFTGLGIAAGAGLGLAARTFAGFDDQMRLVRAVTGSTGAEFAALTEEAKRLGRTTSFTAAEVAAGMVEMGRAGFSGTEIMSSTEQILALSRATATELPRATEIAGAALRGFGLEASEMDRVADVLTASVNGSAQTLEDFFEGMKYVAPLAMEAGASIEDVSASMALLANNGIKGSLAGNAIARAYKNLSGELAQGELRTLGVDAVDAEGNLRSLSDILADIDTATAGMGSARRLSIFESLFGRGQAAALKLAGGQAQFESIRAGLDNVEGLAVRIAEQMEGGIGGVFRRFRAAVEGIGIAIGNALDGPLSALTEKLTRIAGYITRIIDRTPEIVAMIGKVAIGVAALGAGFIGLSVAIKLAGVASIALGVAIKALAAGIAIIKGLGVALLAFNPITLAVGASIAGLGALWYFFSDSATASMNSIGSNFGKLADSLKATWTGVVDALKSGNLALAGEIALTALELVWKTGLAAIKRIWTDWTYDLAGAVVVIEESFWSVVYDALGAVAYLVKEAANLLGMDWLAKEAGLVETGLGIMSRESQGENQFSRIAALEEMRAAENRKLDEGLDKIRARLAELNKTASEEAAQVEFDNATLTSPELKDAKIPEIEIATQTVASANLQEAAGSAAGRGTFSAFVASRIGSRTTYEEESLQAAKRTADAVESIESEMRDGVGI